MADDFTAKYEVDDGYVGGSRPQSFRIRAGDFDICPTTTDEQLEEAFFEMVEEDMQQKISACNVNVDKFIQWARSLPRSRRLTPLASTDRT